MAIQGTLFGHEPVTFPGDFAGVRRIDLGEGAWLDHGPGFLSGHERLLADLGFKTTWRQEQRAMYDKVVAVPRLVASEPGDCPDHPALARVRQALSERYGCDLCHTSLALYRDGNDSVAWHGDRVARELPQSLVVTLSLGAPRPFQLRPKAQPGSAGGPRPRPLTLNLGWGDLVVMGGSCQRTWEHRVPKRKHADPRMVVMFRPSWRADTAPRLAEAVPGAEVAPGARAAPRTRATLRAESVAA